MAGVAKTRTSLVEDEHKNKNNSQHYVEGRIATILAGAGLAMT